MHKNIYKIIKNFFDLPEENKGLTLVELIVVISIFLMITSTVIFNYGGFRSNISLQNLTDDIALSIRKAQSFAIGVRGIRSGFSNSYGIHFSTNPIKQNLVASNKSFLMFFTNTPEKKYDTSATGSCGEVGNDCVELFNITSTDVISKISLNDGEKVLESGEYLDIIFTRPDPRATFCYRTGVASSCSPISISNVNIEISNGQTDVDKLKTKIISVQNTGQISIQ